MEGWNAFFILDTVSLLNPVLDGLSLREPEVTPGAILMVDGYVDGPKSAEDTYVIAYSVSNVGNASAQNVTLATVVDGETQATQHVSSLSVGYTANYSLAVSVTSDELYVVSLQASCEGSADAHSFSFGADVLRAFSDDPERVKLFVTPREPSLVALKNEVLKDLTLKLRIGLP